MAGKVIGIVDEARGPEVAIEEPKQSVEAPSQDLRTISLDISKVTRAELHQLDLLVGLLEVAIDKALESREVLKQAQLPPAKRQLVKVNGISRTLTPAEYADASAKARALSGLALIRMVQIVLAGTQEAARPAEQQVTTSEITELPLSAEERATNDES